MNPKYRSTVEQHIANLDFTNIQHPTEETIQSLLKIEFIEDNKLDTQSSQMFTWCWTQYALFGPAVLNAVEISALTGISAKTVAAYISVYGADWCDKLHSKNQRALGRADVTLIKIGRSYWSLEILAYFAKKATPKTPNQVKVRNWAQRPTTVHLTAYMVMALYTICESNVPVNFFTIPNYFEDGSDTSKTMRTVTRYKGFDCSGEDQTIHAYGVDF